MTLRTLVVDDELMARRRMTRLLSSMNDVEVVGECVDGLEAVERIREGDIDVVLLDINMPNLTGTEALAIIGEDGPVVVFTTAHSEHAVQAFADGAVDYLLKPVDVARLRKALDRARERVVHSPAGLDRLPVNTRKGVVLIDPADISHATIDGESTLIHTAERSFVSDFRLVDLQRRLPDGFLRVHRQALVNVNWLQRLEPLDNGAYIAHLRGGASVQVSRQAARKLRKDWQLPR
jgi:two-component system, LytTR family, response regulator